jgi:hypothetical protein
MSKDAENVVPKDTVLVFIRLTMGTSTNFARNIFKMIHLQYMLTMQIYGIQLQLNLDLHCNYIILP